MEMDFGNCMHGVNKAEVIQPGTIVAFTHCMAEGKLRLHQVPRIALPNTVNHLNAEGNVVGRKGPASQDGDVFRADAVPVCVDCSAVKTLENPLQL